MSARIHEIAKQYNVEPKDMLTWLKEQGFVSANTKSVSSTVSTIFYDEIAKKLGVSADQLRRSALEGSAGMIVTRPSNRSALEWAGPDFSPPASG